MAQGDPNMNVTVGRLVVLGNDGRIYPMWTPSLESQAAAGSSRSTGKRRGKSSKEGEDQFAVRRPQRLPKQPPPCPAFRIMNPCFTRFLFEKILHKSDVGKFGRIVLPKKEVEEHLPYFRLPKDGMWMLFDDMDYYKVWTLHFRSWPNNATRMYIFGNTSEFTTLHGLGVGDSVMFYRDLLRGTYVLRACKNSGKNSGFPGFIHLECRMRSPENDILYLAHEAQDSSDTITPEDVQLQSAMPTDHFESPPTADDISDSMYEELYQILHSDQTILPEVPPPQLAAERASPMMPAEVGGATINDDNQSIGKDVSDVIAKYEFPPLDESLRCPNYYDVPDMMESLYDSTAGFGYQMATFSNEEAHLGRSNSFDSVNLSFFD